MHMCVFAHAYMFVWNVMNRWSFLVNELLFSELSLSVKLNILGFESYLRKLVFLNFLFVFFFFLRWKIVLWRENGKQSHQIL